MPELPEVETIKRYLAPHIIGKSITAIEAREPKQFVGTKEDVVGKKITDVARKGKVLIISLEDNLFLNVHLKMSGQILYANSDKEVAYKNTIPFTGTNKMPGISTRIIFTLNDGSLIFFNDMRKFGWVKVSAQPLVPTSVDVLSPEFTLDRFSSILKESNRPIKPYLMDQEKLAGIGNIYANDALYVARINPLVKTQSLTEKEVARLHVAILEVVNQSIESKGASSADEAFISPDGTRGTYQNHFKVYQQEGKPCKKCGTTILRIKQGGRSTFYCPQCQKVIKVLERFESHLN